MNELMTCLYANDFVRATRISGHMWRVFTMWISQSCRERHFFPIGPGGARNAPMHRFRTSYVEFPEDCELIGARGTEVVLDGSVHFLRNATLHGSIAFRGGGAASNRQTGVSGRKQKGFCPEALGVVRSGLGPLLLGMQPWACSNNTGSGQEAFSWSF